MAEDSLNDVHIGPRLRKTREAMGISMRGLARLSGISANALSMIERGKVSPSVSTLYKLADGLGLPITNFFRDEQSRRNIVFTPLEERSKVAFPHGCWYGLGGDAFVGQVEPLVLDLAPGAKSGPFSMAHTGHEFVMCLEGTLAYQVEGESFMMKPGDSLLFAARLAHTWENPGDSPAKLIVVLSGFHSEERPSEFHYSSVAKGDED